MRSAIASKTVGGVSAGRAEQAPADESREDETRAAIQTRCELAFRDRVEDGIRWTCDTAVSSDVVTGILDYSDANNVDLIAMYTRDRKGLAALRKKSIAKEVRKKASIEVKVFKPGEVVGAT